MKSMTSGLLAFALGLSIPASVFANPLGGVVVNGAANINSAGRLLTISQTSGSAIINWGSFSIPKGETTLFEFNGAAGFRSSVLNRVNIGNPSVIAGMLRSTIGPGGPVGGTVMILNPSGFLFTPTAQVNVGSLVASTLQLADDNEFLSHATLHFSGDSTAGIQNQGQISALGDVYLIAHTVENSGNVRAGNVAGMAAGSAVTLVQSGQERLTVQAGTPGTGAANGVQNTVGAQINAVSAELKAAGGNIYALAINNGGVVRANSVVNQGGRIYLRAGGGNIQNSGTLSAESAARSPASVVVDGGRNAATPSTVVNSGTIEARGDEAGTRGGTAVITGDRVTLAGGSTTDVSGQAGGGTALIGGGFHGANPAVANAQETTVDGGAVIRADAISSGDGGRVAVWSDGATEFNGTIYARALGSQGNGGFAEVSGREHLRLSGHAYLGGVNGRNGQFLLDPGSVDIIDGPDGPLPPNVDVITDGYLINQLTTGGSDVTISTGNSLNGNVENLTVVGGVTPADVSWNSPNSLTLIGNNSVTLEAGTTIANAGLGGLTLQSGGPVAMNGSINLAGSLSVAAAAGAITDGTAGSLNVANNASFSANGAGGAITLDNASGAQFRDADLQLRRGGGGE